MKKIILPLFCALFVFTLSVSAVLAEDGRDGSTNTSPKQSTTSSLVDTKSLRNATKQELEAAKKKFESARDDLKTKLKQKRSNLKDKRFQSFLVRIEKILAERRAALNRLDLIAGKIQTRIDKLKAAGTDVSAMQAALNACSATKAAASKAISDSEASVSSIDLNAANAKDLAKAQVSAIAQSNAALKSYHSCLTSVVNSLSKTNDGKGATKSAQ